MPISQNSDLPVISTGKKTNPSNVPSGFEGVANVNPFENYEYQLGIWDHLGNAFGFRTQEDKVREQMALESANYKAQIASTAREEKYNSELESAQRLREAGLNPDLTGLDDANKASEFTEPQSMPDAFSAPTASEFAGSMVSVMTSLMGLAKDFGNLQLLQEDIDNKKYQNVSALFGATNDFFLNSFGDLMNEDEGEDSTLSDRIHSYVRQHYGDSRFGKKFYNSILQQLHSVGFDEKYYKSLEKSADSRRNYLTEIGRKVYGGKGSFGAYAYEADRGFSEVLGIIGDAIVDYQKSSAELGTKKNELESKTVDELSKSQYAVNIAGSKIAQSEVDLARSQRLSDDNYGDLDAQSLEGQTKADIATASQVAQSKETQAMLEGVLNRVVSSLDDARKDGGIKGGLSTIAMALIMMIKSQMLPNVGYSNKQNVDTATGEVYHTSSLNIGL